MTVVRALAVVCVLCGVTACTKKSPPCTDGCRDLATTRCSGALMQTCVVDEQGCRNWSAPAACSGGTACTADSCCPTPCALSTTQCSGTQIQQCVADTVGCAVWGAAQACTGGQLCDGTINACVADPCQGVPYGGVCLTTTTVRQCVSQASTLPKLVTYSCTAGQTCQIQNGTAKCLSTGGTCTTGATQCLSATQLQTCTGGSWVTSTCANGCQTSGAGSYCVAATGTVNFTGRLLFEQIVPDSTTAPTRWATTPVLTPAEGFLVMSTGSNGSTTYDSTYTGTGATPGTFTVKVPAAPASTDYLFFVASAGDASGLVAAVADPGFPTSTTHVAGGDVPPAPKIWTWSRPTATTAAGDIVIKVIENSAAATVFNDLQRGRRTALAAFPSAPARSIVVWLGLTPATTWDCGACFSYGPINTLGAAFDSQLWIGADTGQAYWSSAVTVHETGHWVMWAYGYPPGEGGTHYIGTPTFPGQAWSEGWATFFSSAARANPVYFDKQRGSMFWLNIQTRTYDLGVTWTRPVPADGMLAMPPGSGLDENEVSAMLYALWSTGTSSRSAIFTALASTRLNTLPFKRGYTEHTWTVDSNGNFTNIADTGTSVPTLPDFLDALNCAGFSRATIDTVTQPATHYAYPSAVPLCP